MESWARCISGAGRGCPTSSSTPISPSTGVSSRRWAAATIGDLGSHLIDMATWMLGPIDDVSAMSLDVSSVAVTTRGDLATWRSTTRHRRWCASRAVLKARWRSRARRRGGRVTSRSRSTGAKGTVMFSYAQLNELWVGNTDDDARLYGLRRVRAEHPFATRDHGMVPIGQGVRLRRESDQPGGRSRPDVEARTWSPDFAVVRTSRRSVPRWSDRSVTAGGCRSKRSRRGSS